MDGERLSHYLLKQPLGAGAMGEVWLAEDLSLHRPVALKMLKADADPEATARLVREARVASTLSHPNVAVVYEVGEADRAGRPVSYIAMEHVPGRTLAELVHDGPLEAATALRLTRQVERRPWLTAARAPIELALETLRGEPRFQRLVAEGGR